MFYREVSHMQDIIPALIKVEEEHLSYGSTETIVNTMQSTNRIILTMLRSRAYELISSPEGDMGVPHVTGELTTWNASIESSLLRALLIQQHGITLNKGISLAKDPSTRETLLQNVMDLTGLVLDGFEHELQLLQRSNVDVELMKLDQHEKTASLAEKYLDFDILVGLCEATNNQSSLNRYIIQFADKGFSDFTFNWYIKEGNRGKLLSQTAFQQDNLKQFLKNHNDLSWLNDINQGRYTEGVAAGSQIMFRFSDEVQILSLGSSSQAISKLRLFSSSQTTIYLGSQDYFLILRRCLGSQPVFKL
ncbi:hypothetical protein CHUAL_011261 [Chamberlinius hualienensis]